MFSYFYIFFFFFFSHGRSVVSLSHLYISFFRCRCRRDLSRLVFLGNKNRLCVSSTSRSVYGSSDERGSQEREIRQKYTSRKYLIGCSLFDSFAISGSVRRSIVGSQVRSVSAHSLFLRARVRSLQDERKRR